MYNNLTPSPIDSQPMMMMVGIDSPDSGNYSNSSIQSEAKRARLPGQAVQLNKVTSESIDETRVEIQITEDGHIEVISDKETTV